jgi:diguanylate cyclase (GGDEF)-like protein/PAS domain S-box-containing protein
MPTPPSSSQTLVRASALIAALLLLLALAMRWQHETLRLHPSTVLFVALGFATFAALIWVAGRRLRRLESDKQELALDYRTILDATPEGVIVFDKAGTITLATKRAEELFGYAPGELVGAPLDRLVPERVRDKHIRRRNEFVSQAAGNAVFQGERMLARRKDGSEFLASLNVGARNAASGIAMTLFVEDISRHARHEAELNRIHRALRLLSEANQVMRKADSQIELLQAICRVIIQSGGYRFAFIGYAENDAGKSVHPVAWDGFEDGYLNELVVTWDDSPTGRGTAGTAIRNGQPVVVRSIARDANMAPWRGILLQRGYASVAAFPLRIEGIAQAVLVIYAATEDAFGQEECVLLEDFAADISHGIGALRDAESRTRAEAALRRSESILDRAQQIAHVGSWEWDLLGREVRWSDQMFRIFGYEPGEIEPSRDTSFARIHPEDRERVSGEIKALMHGEASSLEIDHRVAWEDGLVRHVHMMCEVEFRAGLPSRVIGSAQDTTAQVRREIELQRTNRALRMLSAVSQTARQATSEADLLQRACDIVVVTGGYTFAWIAGKEHGPERRVALLASAGKPAIRQRIDADIVSWDADHPRGQGTVGRALRSGEPCIVRDVLTDPIYAAWRDLALEDGFSATASFPLRVDGKIEGALVIYAGNDTFGDAECELIEDLAGDIAHALATLRAEAARNEAEAALRRNEALLGRAEALAHVGSWEWDLRTKTLQWSDETYRIFGFRPHEVKPELELALAHTHPDDRSFLNEKLSAVAKGEALSTELDFRILLPDDQLRWVHTKAEMEYHDSGPLRMTGVLQDISERKRLEQKLSEMASFDSLTGLPNRNLLNDRLGQALAHARRNDGLMAVGFVDLDRFKVINDSLGHDAGDELLKEIACRLSGCLRNSDTVARQGGDEFVVVLTELTRPEDATIVAQKLLEALSPPVTLKGREIVPGASIGFAVYPKDGDNLQGLLMAADKAMYAAKHAGRGQYRFFDPEMNRAAANWLEVGAELHHALERDEFELHYQPKVDLRSGAITGVEALLRWRNPELGLVPPNKFIPILEETGLILEVGEWVIARACRQARLWQEQGLPPLRIAVNLSPRQFQQHGLAERIRTLIDQPDFLPEYLELEITESMVMLNVERAIAMLEELRQLGVHIAIDDFGTGYSSLAVLKRFPVDCLKVDRSFVRDIPDDADDMAITRSVILLAHSMGLSVVAEGVETEAQQTFLVECGCDEMQGFLFSKPLPAAELAERVLGHMQKTALAA